MFLIDEMLNNVKQCNSEKQNYRNNSNLGKISLCYLAYIICYTYERVRIDKTSLSGRSSFSNSVIHLLSKLTATLR